MSIKLSQKNKIYQALFAHLDSELPLFLLHTVDEENPSGQGNMTEKLNLLLEYQKIPQDSIVAWMIFENKDG